VKPGPYLLGLLVLAVPAFGVSALLGLPFDLGRPGTAWYVIGAVPVVEWLHRLPLLWYREPPEPVAEAAGRSAARAVG
jgi:hypothetical protein